VPLKTLSFTVEQFLLELGNDFSFIARQENVCGSETNGIEWTSVFFHRPFAMSCNHRPKNRQVWHADAGQMNLYLNYAREHWTLPGEIADWSDS